MNRAKFFAALRRNSSVFGASLSQRQVEGTEALLDAGEGLPASYLAHVLGESYHETGGGMYPVKETVYSYSKDQNPSDATVIARLDRAWAKGQLSWVSKPYWRDGMFGRGQIQITHEDNYRKLSPYVGVDLVKDPSAALRLDISAKIAVEGCRRGLFTGARLAAYDKGGKFDHDAARAIVNGDRRKHMDGTDGRTIGQAITLYATAFENALIEAGYSAKVSAPQAPVTPPAIEQPDPVEAPGNSLAALRDALVALAAWFLNIFGRNVK